MNDDELKALHAVVEESAETVRLLRVFHGAILKRGERRGAVVTVLPVRLEVVPAELPLVAVAAKG